MNNLGTNQVENKISKYTGLLTESGPVSISECSVAKNDSIHKTLFDRALERWSKASKTDLSVWRITEMKRPDPLAPPVISMVMRMKPYDKKRVDLSEWWDSKSVVSEFAPNPKNGMPIDMNGVAPHPELMSLDYIRGYARMRDRISGQMYEVPFGSINSETEVSEDLEGDPKTFTEIRRRSR